MALADEYKKQYAWRDWDKALSHCPVMPGQQVLDLGCGPGDLSAALSARGALVTGVDGNADLLAVAKERCPQGVFEKQDLSALELETGKYDGLWCSFTAAYFTGFESVFAKWKNFLKPKAWVCIIDIDHLFGHEPLSIKTREKLDAFYQEFLQKGHYDFRAGDKIKAVLEKNGFTVTSLSLKDKELSFTGPADSDVARAWQDRLDRMRGMQTFFGADFISFREEFMRCITSAEHQSLCKVICCVGTRG